MSNPTSGFIVDPEDSTKAIVTPSGRMAGSVWMAPVGTDPQDTSAWRHIGFSGDPEPFTPHASFTIRLPKPKPEGVGNE